MIFLTKMFQPSIKLMPSELNALQCKSQKLFLYTGLIVPSTPGTFTIMPILNKSLSKLSALIEDSMSKIGGEKCIMPSLGIKALWNKTGRWSEMGGELFKLKDRSNKDLCLCPTHEEEVTNIVSMYTDLSHRHLPIKLYQITTKFRDEPLPKFGLLRAREFLMKDLYTFDASLESAERTYDIVSNEYSRILTSLQVPYIKVLGFTGTIGGKKSHEFHILSDVGEDHLAVCSKCSKGYNRDFPDGRSTLQCEDCDCPVDFNNTKGIEVGHCFLLGDKYSSRLKANYKTDSHKTKSLQMGCYGIGVSRLLAASVEALSSDDCIRWPKLISPFKLAVLQQKNGAKDVLSTNEFDSLCTQLVKKVADEDILIDDRPTLTIGRKVVDMNKLGIPFLVVAKKKEGEYLELIDTYKGKSMSMNTSEISDFIHDYFL